MENIEELFVSEKNFEIFNIIKNHFNLIIKPSDEHNYKSRLVGSDFEIYVDTNNITQEAFTHELLHGYLRASGHDISGDFEAVLQSSDNVTTIFSDPLIEHVGNCLEHVKMHPFYIKAGYQNHLFISDHETKKCTDKEINHIKSHFNSNGIYLEAVDFYIGKFVAIKACTNKYHRYSNQIDALVKIDKNLFFILNAFWSDWLTFDVQNKEDRYEEIFEIFFDDLETWMEGKNFKSIY